MNTEDGHSGSLLLWGASGHGKVVFEVARAMDRFKTISFIDDACGEVPHEFFGCRVFAADQYLQSRKDTAFSHKDSSQYLVSIGRNDARAACFRRALDHGLLPATLVHPSAMISESALLGDGTVVMAKVVVNAGAQIGRNCIINTAAVVEHDCCIGDHVHLSPGAILAGGVTVHSLAHVGTGAVVLPGLEIGAGAIVGAGAVVVNSVPAGVTVAGVPARQFVVGER